MDTLFQIYVVCSALLVVNLLYLANGTALTRAKQGKFLNPEDKKLNEKGELQEIDQGLVARYRRAHLNALENILPFLPMGFLFITVRPSVVVAGVVLGIFTFFRWLHSIAYIKQLQPWRTASFAIAALDLVAMVGITVYKVLV